MGSKKCNLHLAQHGSRHVFLMHMKSHRNLEIQPIRKLRVYRYEIPFPLAPPLLIVLDVSMRRAVGSAKSVHTP